MNGDQFVNAVKKVVSNTAVAGTLSSLRHPAGRSPRPELVAMSDWYRDLDERGREMVELMVQRTASHSVFGFLAVLDGVRAIEDGDAKGELELLYAKGSSRVLLNDPSGEPLHDIFNRL